MFLPAQHGGWEDGGAGVTGLVDADSGCSHWSEFLLCLLRHSSHWVPAPCASWGSLPSQRRAMRVREQAPTDHRPRATVWAVESQQDIGTSGKEHVPMAAAWPRGFRCLHEAEQKAGRG